MVVSLSSLEVVLQIAFVCMIRSNSRVDFARYVFLNVSVIIYSTCIHLISKCAERQHNHSTITINYN